MLQNATLANLVGKLVIAVAVPALAIQLHEADSDVECDCDKHDVGAEYELLDTFHLQSAVPKNDKTSSATSHCKNADPTQYTTRNNNQQTAEHRLSRLERTEPELENIRIWKSVSRRC